jgi:uncharacterized protein
MRLHLTLLTAIATTALAAGLLTYPVWLLISQFADYRPDRVMHRIWELLLCIALWRILRRNGMATWQAVGFSIPRAVFVRQLSIGLSAGLLLMLPLAAALFWTDVRLWNGGATSIPLLLAKGLLAGLVVACLEETVVRGAVFGALQRESGPLVAILFTSLLFAAAHFFRGQLRIPAEEMNVWSGLRLVADIFAQYAQPLRIADAFLALMALAVLLALIRLQTGAIAGSIGLHAGGVAASVVLRACSTANPLAEPAWLVPSYNVAVGWLACVWISVVTVCYWWIGRGGIGKARHRIWLKQ